MNLVRRHNARVRKMNRALRVFDGSIITLTKAEYNFKPKKGTTEVYIYFTHNGMDLRWIYEMVLETPIQSVEFLRHFFWESLMEYVNPHRYSRRLNQTIPF